MTASGAPQVSQRRTGRAVWVALGCVAVALGTVGIVVPGLPTVGFFVLAAWAFSRSNPRLEQWVLDRPGIGPMVRDHRAGLGMPRRAKVLAITMLVVSCTVSIVFAVEGLPVRAAIALAGGIGVAWILWRIPTRETVLAGRSAARV
jgi:uncharacterized protein